MKNYFIADNEGNIYAHDIQSYSAAVTKLNDLLSTMSEKEAEELEIEIIEE